MSETRFYWFVELLVQPPKYLRDHNTSGAYPCGAYWGFTDDPHLADKYNKGQAEGIAAEYRRRGLNVEAREHGFMAMGPTPTSASPLSGLKPGEEGGRDA